MPSYWINKSQYHLKEQSIGLYNIDFMDFIATRSAVIGCRTDYPLHTHAHSLHNNTGLTHGPTSATCVIMRFLLLTAEAGRNLYILHIAGDRLIWQSSNSSCVSVGDEDHKLPLVFFYIFIKETKIPLKLRNTDRIK